MDEAIVRTLITRAGGTPGPTYCKQGKAPLRTSINGYNNAARHAPWLVLMDLDRDADCAPHLCQELVPLPAPRLCFRIAVRQVGSVANSGCRAAGALPERCSAQGFQRSRGSSEREDRDGQHCTKVQKQDYPPDYGTARWERPVSGACVRVKVDRIRRNQVAFRDRGTALGELTPGDRLPGTHHPNERISRAGLSVNLTG